MAKSLTLKSYAKINFNLKVLGRRPDGYHEIDSLIQNISLHDEITLTETNQGIAVSCLYLGVPQGKENIAYKAAEVFLNTTGIDKGVDVSIEKKIPVASGLGGGSSNAAAVIIGLDQMFGTNMGRMKMLGLAESVGSDVPFFIEGGTVHVRGRGEIIEKLSPSPETWIVVVVPSYEVRAKFAYDEFDKILAFRLRRKEAPKLSSVEISSWATSSILHNDLEEAVSAKHKEITKIKERLLSLGATGAAMSGSGPAVFGLAQDEAQAKSISERLKKDYPRTFLVKTVDKSVEIGAD